MNPIYTLIMIALLVVTTAATPTSTDPAIADTQPAPGMIMLPMVLRASVQAPKADEAPATCDKPAPHPYTPPIDPIDPPDMATDPIIPQPEPIPAPVVTCGQWQESGPHPCPGGQGNGQDNGDADMATPAPEPQRNGNK